MGDSDTITVELFLYFCKKVGLSIMELDYLTIGMCLDYFDEFIEREKKEDKKSKGRKPSQSDFDSF
ncbi:MAG: hypothetical protein MR510_08495 [Clostridium sp.]|nr:hypothetical protein [Clostridium sp.]